MVDAPWPNGLRAAGALGVSGGPQANALVFTPETGPPINRRTSTTVVRSYTIELPLITAAQRQIFLTFFHDTLKDGNLPFVWVDPMQGRFPFIYAPYAVESELPDLVLDMENDIYAVDLDTSTDFYQRMKFVITNGQQAYNETRVTPELFNLQFKVVLLR